MKSKISPGSVAVLLNELQSGVPTSQQFPKLLAQFKPLIHSMAGGFSYEWKKDFIQEGTIGLFKALNTLSTGNVSTEKFISYAAISIRSSMTDFYRKVISKSMKERTEYSIDAGEYKFMEPVFVGLTPSKFDGDEHEDPMYNVPSLFDSASATIQGIDFKYNFSHDGLTRNGFSEKEITAFNLHIMQGYGVGEVAKHIGVSLSQSSKIISKVRNKVLHILSYSQKSIKN